MSRQTLVGLSIAAGALLLLPACGEKRIQGDLPERPSRSGGSSGLDIASLRARAEKGDGGAQVILGSLYAHGTATRLNHSEALKWLRKAADKGESQGQLELGRMYAEGRGVQQDYTVAAQLYRKSADQGNCDGGDALADLYAKGQGVEQNFAESFVWYSLGLHCKGNYSGARRGAAEHLAPDQLAAAQKRVRDLEHALCAAEKKKYPSWPNPPHCSETTSIYP